MDFLKSQLTKIPLITPVNLSKSTVLITGANTGLGLEVAREIVRSKPERLILAVRNLEKGDIAKKDLDRAKSSGTRIEVHKLDQSSFDSIQAFAKELDGERIDIAILNAGVWNTKFITTPDGHESDLQVNALGPALLSLLLLPNLRAAAASPHPPGAPRPHMTIVSSGLHEMAKFPEKNLPRREILSALDDEKRYTQSDRYPVTKTINLLWTRALASKVPSSEIIINAPTPGFCKTGLMRHTSGVMNMIVKLAMVSVGRSAEDGARCLVDAAIVKKEETHGKYLSETKLKPESQLVQSEEGQELQAKVWDEIMAVFAKKSIPVQASLASK
jgi:retinol dehydrogenase-12